MSVLERSRENSESWEDKRGRDVVEYYMTRGTAL